MEIPRPQSVFLDLDDRVATLTIDRPPLNILDLQTLDELGASLVDLSVQTGLQMVILRAYHHRAKSPSVILFAPIDPPSSPRARRGFVDPKC